jgi:hypothetical protein
VLIPWNQQPFGITVLLLTTGTIADLPALAGGPIAVSQPMTEEAKDVRTKQELRSG